MLTPIARISRKRVQTIAFVVAMAAIVLTGGAAASPGGGKGGGKADKAPPSISIIAPTPGATLSGTATVSGSASDNVGVAKVEVAVDGGTYQAASGTTAWTVAFNSVNYGNGSHSIAARATDAAGNATIASVTVSVNNLASPPPSSPSDTTPPAVAIALPTSGSTVSGTASISGTASDNVALAKVEISVDGGAYQAAQGTSNWGVSVNTAGYTNGTHALAARATDTSGNVASTSESITVANSSSLPAGVKEQMVTPEGATIQIYSDVTGWTAQQIYNLLKPNALELSKVGPSLTIKVQTQYPCSTSASVSESGGVYTTYKAAIYLQATPTSVFPDYAESVVAHEYGHAWTLYHLYMSHSGDWTSYLSARGLRNDPRVDTTYAWSKREMIADDYRVLFGTPTAVSQATYLNPDAPDPRTVTGLKDWFLNVWALP